MPANLVSRMFRAGAAARHGTRRVGMFDDISISLGRGDLPTSMRAGGYMGSRQRVIDHLGGMEGRSPGVMAGLAGRIRNDPTGGMARGATEAYNLRADHSPLHAALRRMERRDSTPLQQMMDPHGRLRSQAHSQQQAHAGRVGAMVRANTPATPGAAAMGPVHQPTLANKSAQSQSQFTPRMMHGGAGMLNVGGALAGGMIGGTASYITGGEFGTGFVAGVGGAFAGKALKRAALNNMAAGGGLTMTKKFASEGGAKATAASALNGAATSLQTAKTRTAMMGGAALGGVMFGGDRSSHSRGFNQSRGNRF